MVKDRVAAFALVAAAGTVMSCSARVSDDSRLTDQGFAKGASEARGGLYPIRYGYRGGPYTHNGKPRPKTDAGLTREDVPPAPL